jgi:hypothetical protein
MRIANTLKATVLYLAILPAVAVSITGCDKSQVINAVNVVLTEAQAVVRVAEPNAPWLADFDAAVAAVKAAESSWQSGGAVEILQSALATLANVCAVIPATAQYAPLIAVLVAAISAVIALIPQKGPSMVAALAPSPYAGMVAAPKTPHESVVQWNAIVNAHPELKAAHIN